MSKRIRDASAISTALLAAIIGNGQEAHQEHVNSLAGTENTPTPFNEFLASHIQNHAIEASDDDWNNLMSCFGLADDDDGEEATSATEDDGESENIDDPANIDDNRAGIQ